MHDVIIRVTVCRPTLEADVRSTPEDQFTFSDDTELVEDAIQMFLEDEGASVQENATLRSIMQRSRQMSEQMVMKRHRISVGFHNGKLQVLPPLWYFPKMNANQLIDNWYVGDNKAGVPPFYYLTEKHVEHLGTKKNKVLGRMKLRQMKSAMKAVERLSR